MNVTHRFPFRDSSVPKARHFVAERLETLPSEVGDAVTLVVSELATNAIRHAHTGFTVTVDVDDHEVKISVTDSGSGRVKVERPLPTATSGRGLRIVELLSDRWGVVPSVPKPGKTVWFTIRFDGVVQPREEAGSRR